MNKKIIKLIALPIVVIFASTYVACKPPKTIQKNTNIPVQGNTTLSAGNITMKVWDNDTEDGDTISVFFDNKLVQSSLGILNTPVSYNLGNITSGTYYLDVKAISEGMSSPASVTVSLSDGKKEQEFEMNATVNTPASWQVIIK